jgi:hypothetical protein
VAILGLSACGDSAPGPVDPVEPFGSITVQVIAPGVTAYGDITARVVWGEQNLTAAVDANGLAVEIERANPAIHLHRTAKGGTSCAT